MGRSRGLFLRAWALGLVEAFRTWIPRRVEAVQVEIPLWAAALQAGIYVACAVLYVLNAHGLDVCRNGSIRKRVNAAGGEYYRSKQTEKYDKLIFHDLITLLYRILSTSCTMFFR